MSNKIFMARNNILHTYNTTDSIVKEFSITYNTIMKYLKSDKDYMKNGSVCHFYKKKPHTYQLKGLNIEVDLTPLENIGSIHKDAFVALVELVEPKTIDDFNLYYSICKCSYDKMTRLKRIIIDAGRVTDEVRDRVTAGLNNRQYKKIAEIKHERSSSGVQFTSKSTSFWRED